jgi:hypothetical protein
LFAGREEQGARNEEGYAGYECVNDEKIEEVEMKKMKLVYHVSYVTLVSE